MAKKKESNKNGPAPESEFIPILGEEDKYDSAEPSGMTTSTGQSGTTTSAGQSGTTTSAGQSGTTTSAGQSGKTTGTGK